MKNVWLLCLILVYLIPIGMVAYQGVACFHSNLHDTDGYLYVIV